MRKLQRRAAAVAAAAIVWDHITFVFSDHLAMTRDPAFTDNILFRLLESPR